MKKRTLILAVVMMLSVVPFGNKTIAATTDETPVATAEAKAELRQIFLDTNKECLDMSRKEDILVQKSVFTSIDNRLAAFAQSYLVNKDKKLKYNVYDVNKDGTAELFALYSTGKMEVYRYDEIIMQAIVDPSVKGVKPLGKVNNVKELRACNGSAFMVKTVKGKTVSYTKYQFSLKRITKGKSYKPATYNKLKKRVFKKADVKVVTDIYDDTDYRLMSGNAFYASTHSSLISDPVRTVFRYDKEDTLIPFKAFLELASVNQRLVFGPTEIDPKSAEKKSYMEEDWTYFRDQIFGLKYFIPYIRPIIEDKPDYNVKEVKESEDGLVSYEICKVTDGKESDEHTLVTIKKDADGKKRVATIGYFKAGDLEATRLYVFRYGDKATIDGELYSPGIDSMMYPSDTYQGSVRKFPIDCNGIVKNLVADKNTLFALCSKTGVFNVDGTDIDYLFFAKAEGDEYKRINGIVNPVDPKGGYLDIPTADGAGKITWKPAA